MLAASFAATLSNGEFYGIARGNLQDLEVAANIYNLVLAIDGSFWYLFVIPLNFWNGKALFCTSAKHLYL